MLVPLGAESEDGCLRLARRFIQLEKGRRRECLSKEDVSNKQLQSIEYASNGTTLTGFTKLGGVVDLPCGLGAASAVAIVSEKGRDRDCSRMSYKGGNVQAMVEYALEESQEVIDKIHQVKTGVEDKGVGRIGLTPRHGKRTLGRLPATAWFLNKERD